MIAPTGGPAWVTDWVNGDHFSGGSSTPAAVSGYPAITVPAGFVHGLPIGLGFFAGAWGEPSLIKFAYAFEQATHARKPPQFRSRIAIPWFSVQRESMSTSQSQFDTVTNLIRIQRSKTGIGFHASPPLQIARFQANGPLSIAAPGIRSTLEMGQNR